MKSNWYPFSADHAADTLHDILDEQVGIRLFGILAQHQTDHGSLAARHFFEQMKSGW